MGLEFHSLSLGPTVRSYLPNSVTILHFIRPRPSPGLVYTQLPLSSESKHQLPVNLCPCLFKQFYAPHCLTHTTQPHCSNCLSPQLTSSQLAPSITVLSFTPSGGPTIRPILSRELFILYGHSP